MDKQGRVGFTLVELLVVIAIIAMLAGILLPAITSAFAKAEKTQVQAEVNAIKAAIQAYYNDYAKMPMSSGHGQTDDGSPGTDADDTVKILTADPSVKTYNPRGIVYLDLSRAITNGALYDAWGIKYKVRLDRNYDGRVDTMATIAIVSSAGPDSDFNATADNITSSQ